MARRMRVEKGRELSARKKKELPVFRVFRGTPSPCDKQEQSLRRHEKEKKENLLAPVFGKKGLCTPKTHSERGKEENIRSERNQEVLVGRRGEKGLERGLHQLDVRKKRGG